MGRKSAKFIILTTLIYSLVYLFVGAITYQLITKQFYVGIDPIFTAFLRSEANPSQWAHVMQWQLPLLLLRGLLIAIVLYLFIDALRSLSLRKRIGVLFAVNFILVHLSSAAPSPSNIEGIVYMRPELMNVESFLLTQPEMIIQSLLFAVAAAYIINKLFSPKTKTV